MYFTHGLAKVELALARGRRSHEKRQAIAEREHQREIQQSWVAADRLGSGGERDGREEGGMRKQMAIVLVALGSS